MLDFIVMQMSRINREKGYYDKNYSEKFQINNKPTQQIWSYSM